jgi:integrase
MRLMVYSGKGDKDRQIPFTLDVAAAIANLDLLERLEPGDHVWHRRRYPVGDRRRRGDPIGDTTFETWYRDMIELAGVRYLNPHQTRHTYHWWLRQGGLDLEERQALLGHESPETTVRQYGRIEFEDIAAKVARL